MENSLYSYNASIAHIKGGRHYTFFYINVMMVRDSSMHGCFMHSIFDFIRENTDIENYYVIGLMGSSSLPSASHYGVFSSIHINAYSSEDEKVKIVDFIWRRLTRFLEKYQDELSDDCDQYIIKCVPLEKEKGEFYLKKGVKITQDALKIKDFSYYG